MQNHKPYHIFVCYKTCGRIQLKGIFVTILEIVIFVIILC